MGPRAHLAKLRVEAQILGLALEVEVVHVAAVVVRRAARVTLELLPLKTTGIVLGCLSARLPWQGGATHLAAALVKLLVHARLRCRECEQSRPQRTEHHDHYDGRAAVEATLTV